jgi:hypothetical protein
MAKGASFGALHHSGETREVGMDDGGKGRALPYIAKANEPS